MACYKILCHNIFALKLKKEITFMHKQQYKIL